MNNVSQFYYLVCCVPISIEISLFYIHLRKKKIQTRNSKYLILSQLSVVFSNEILASGFLLKLV